MVLWFRNMKPNNRFVKLIIRVNFAATDSLFWQNAEEKEFAYFLSYWIHLDFWIPLTFLLFFRHPLHLMVTDGNTRYEVLVNRVITHRSPSLSQRFIIVRWQVLIIITHYCLQQNIPLHITPVHSGGKRSDEWVNNWIDLIILCVTLILPQDYVSNTCICGVLNNLYINILLRQLRFLDQLKYIIS